MVAVGVVAPYGVTITVVALCGVVVTIVAPCVVLWSWLYAVWHHGRWLGRGRP